ncbi:17017_t:CDS:2, partial [Gigaspora margarita]
MATPDLSLKEIGGRAAMITIGIRDFMAYRECGDTGTFAPDRSQE